MGNEGNCFFGLFAEQFDMGSVGVKLPMKRLNSSETTVFQEKWFIRIHLVNLLKTWSKMIFQTVFRAMLKHTRVLIKKGEVTLLLKLRY